MESKTIPDECVIDFENNEVSIKNTCQSEENFNIDNIANNSFNSGANAAESVKSIDNTAVDEIIVKALEKVKAYFVDSQIDEQKVAEFMFKILNFNSSDEERKILNPQLVDKMVNDMTKIDITSADINTLYSAVEEMLGENTAKMIYDKICTDNVDEILESLLGEDTKKIMCDKLDSDNLDELLNKLIDEKLNLQSSAEHSSFNEFIEKILGKDTEEFIKKKLEMFAVSAIDDTLLDNIGTKTETGQSGKESTAMDSAMDDPPLENDESKIEYDQVQKNE